MNSFSRLRGVLESADSNGKASLKVDSRHSLNRDDDDEYGDRPLLNQRNSLGAGGDDQDSEDDFGNDRPNVAQEERVFNLTGAGRPKPELKIVGK